MLPVDESSDEVLFVLVSHPERKRQFTKTNLTKGTHFYLVAYSVLNSRTLVPRSMSQSLHIYIYSPFCFGHKVLSLSEKLSQKHWNLPFSQQNLKSKKFSLLEIKLFSRAQYLFSTERNYKQLALIDPWDPWQKCQP